ncbi:hypothetical protein [Acinetobacter indicus]|uniref:hypothetical protein n=1 Tax=Acinetobacter indicus TaxID=756892 RepID=UPI00209ACE03|nr:hypothetical protein [Acinetobacter indicus]MCO8100924.1 hypothetical protein [Acinetobacter indicus]MCO8106509.1 hypothetical protein [Acinetobacter indicus]MCO8112235.1 hypothetical protein [Acinetobacter indicus]
MNLIEKLGLEKCKQIVDGAPDQTADYYLYDTYFKSKNPVEWFYWEENQWRFTSHSKRFANFLISLKDLRAALADHDRTDHCSDIKNHISPTTKVIER